MESSILEVLEFDITFPSPLRFLERFSKLMNLDQRCFSLAMFLLQTILCDYSQMTNKPSIIAAGAVHVASLTFRGGASKWEHCLVKETGITEEMAKESTKALRRSLENVKKNLDLKSFAKRKFSSGRFYEVGKLTSLRFPK